MRTPEQQAVHTIMTRRTLTQEQRRALAALLLAVAVLPPSGSLRAVYEVALAQLAADPTDHTGHLRPL